MPDSPRAISDAHLKTYVSLLTWRTQQANRPVRFIVAIGKGIAVISTEIELQGETERQARCYVILETALAFTIPSHDKPDPEFIGNIMAELHQATLSGELQRFKEHMQDRVHKAEMDQGLN